MTFLETKTAKVISCIALSIFLWIFGGLYDIAIAAKSGNLMANSAGPRSKDQRVEKKFENAITDIEHILEKSKTKKTRAERKAEKERLRAKKREIEEHDRELRKRFKETEERIKDLPDEIKKRHRDFVNNYEANLKELKSRIDAIDRAKTEEDEDREIKKAREYLKKAKPQKKHIPLDPNKLPHRTSDVEKIRLEEKKETGKKRIMPKLRKKRAGLLNDDISSADNILVAANGSLDGILNQPLPEIQDQTPLLLAQATSRRPWNAPPTEADLAETIDVQFTDAIRAKAAELGNKPVQMYEWVRNNVEFVPTYGSIQGADYCLQTLQCNAFDTSSLLIALFRVSGFPAQYVYGTKEIPIEKFMNWVGNFTNPNAALSFAASGGIPVGGLTEGGKIVSAQFEHIWVKVYIPYGNYRGMMRDDSIKTWIPLDASYKQYTYTEGIDIKEAVPFDAQTFIDQIQSTATINEEEGYVTGVDSLYIQQTMDDYKTQVENYINQNNPDATVGDVLGTKEIIKKNYGMLSATTMYKTTGIEWVEPELPDNLRHKISFSVTLDNLLHDASPLTITKSLPELAGKKITLSYSPATQADEDVINAYLPKPHDDGTPIDPSELPSSLPAYLINLKPELRVDGEVEATGGPVMMGLTETFNMTFMHPQLSTDAISNTVEAGEYLGISINTGLITQKHMNAIKDKVNKTIEKLKTANFAEMSKDDILGDILYANATSYFTVLDSIKKIQANFSHVEIIRLPSEAIFSFELDISKSFYDIPLSARPLSFSMDVDRDFNVVKAVDGSKDKKIEFMLISGMNSSALEYKVPEMMFSDNQTSVEGISAVKALKIANDQGIPIYSINQKNINEIISKLQISDNIKTQILNAVNAGNEVTISKSNINFNGWIGCGYIIIDPSTGAGSYMINEEVNGGFLSLLWFSTALLGLFLSILLLSGPIGMLAGFIIMAVINALISVIQMVGSMIIKCNLEGGPCEITEGMIVTTALDFLSQTMLGSLGIFWKLWGLLRPLFAILSTELDWLYFFGSDVYF